MMNEDTDLTSAVIEAFDKRDRIYEALTQFIADSIHDTVLVGICKFFAVEESKVEWVDFHFDGNHVTIAAVITYDSGAEVPELVEMLSPTTDHFDSTQRIVKANIPLFAVDHTPDQICALITERAQALRESMEHDDEYDVPEAPQSTPARRVLH